jgi:N utilization substance protein B
VREVTARGPRRQAREAALQILYAAEVSGKLEPDAVEQVYREVIDEFSLPARCRDRARELVVGVGLNLKRIDERISAASTRWKLYRIAAVDRSILRIATYELLFEPEIPTEVVIDEALEVSRRFASESSPAFVNGVLDVIARQRETSEE